jgi:hypothetical protein
VRYSVRTLDIMIRGGGVPRCTILVLSYDIWPPRVFYDTGVTWIDDGSVVDLSGEIACSRSDE